MASYRLALLWPAEIGVSSHRQKLRIFSKVLGPCQFFKSWTPGLLEPAVRQTERRPKSFVPELRFCWLHLQHAVVKSASEIPRMISNTEISGRLRSIHLQK